MADLENVYACSLCDSFASPSFATVLRHIGNTRASDYNLNISISCPVSGCLRSYTNFASFRLHVYRKHRSLLDRAKHINVVSEPISPGGSPTHDQRGKYLLFVPLHALYVPWTYAHRLLLQYSFIDRLNTKIMRACFINNLNRK